VETKSLSYAELGEALGITAASAKRLAIRRKWPKAAGNDGRSRVTVPVDYLEHERPAAGDDAGDVPEVDAGDAPGDVTRDDGDAARAVAAILGGHITQLRGDLEAVQAKLAAVEAERDAERVRAGQVEVLTALMEAERRRADELRAERDRWQEEATRPRGLLAWLRRA
jgi:hypothetical protein